MKCSRIRRNARPTIATATPPSRNGGGGHPGADFGDIGDIFETIFGSAFGGGGRARPRRGADLRYDMQIDLEEAFHGKSTEIEIEVSQNCDNLPRVGSNARNPCTHLQPVPWPGPGPCQTRVLRGRTAMPQLPRQRRSNHLALPRLSRGRTDRQGAGARGGDSSRRRYRHAHPPVGQGRGGPRGAPPGDLYIFIHVKPHDISSARATTLATRVPISFTAAALGRGPSTFPTSMART